MKVQKLLRAIGFTAAFAFAGLAQAGVMVSVNSNANSFVDGAAKYTGITVAAGQKLEISVDPSQLWNFGGGNPDLTVNADGLPGWFMDVANPDGSNFTGLIGSLVGQIGNGNFFTVGTDFDGFANASGKLNLFFWDSDAWNNSGSVQAAVEVPEPASMALFGLGLLALARTRRRA